MKLFVKPTAQPDGTVRVIRDPATGQRIPAAGTEVEKTPFWLTAIRVGDVSMVEKPPSAAQEPRSPETASPSPTTPTEKTKPGAAAAEGGFATAAGGSFATIKD